MHWQSDCHIPTRIAVLFWYTATLPGLMGMPL